MKLVHLTGDMSGVYDVYQVIDAIIPSGDSRSDAEGSRADLPEVVGRGAGGPDGPAAPEASGGAAPRPAGAAASGQFRPAVEASTLYPGTSMDQAMGAAASRRQDDRIRANLLAPVPQAW